MPHPRGTDITRHGGHDWTTNDKPGKDNIYTSEEISRWRFTQRNELYWKEYYYIDKSVLVENRPLVKLIRNYIRDSSGVFFISSLLRISITSFPAFVQKYSCLCKEKKITRRLEDMNFILLRAFVLFLPLENRIHIFAPPISRLHISRPNLGLTVSGQLAFHVWTLFYIFSTSIEPCCLLTVWKVVWSFLLPFNMLNDKFWRSKWHDIL